MSREKQTCASGHKPVRLQEARDEKDRTGSTGSPGSPASGDLQRSSLVPHGENMTDFRKGGTQWETKAAKRTKRRARNRRQPNKKRI